MEIRNLKTFLMVAALQNFTQSSRELGYSQSNVSAQIQQLEREIGAPLFNRIGHSVSLTQYGEEMLPYARRIVEMAGEMENFLKSEKALGGTVRIGMVESLFSLLPEDIFIQYHERFPYVKLELTVDATEVLKKQLQLGTLDIACVIDEHLPEARWQCKYALDAPIVLVGNPMHPFAQKEKLKMQDLVGQDFVLMEETAPYMLQFQQVLANHHLSIRAFLKLQSADAACRLVEKGNFFSVIPYYSVQKAEKSGKVKVFSVPEMKISQAVQIILHSNKVQTPQIAGLIEELEIFLGNIMRHEKE